MIIGYVTVEEANTYIEQHYLETDQIRNTWEDLEDESKEILLRRSYEIIDQLPFSGRKSFCSQQTAFPRYPSSEVPRGIKYAQIENALSLSDEDVQEESSFYNKLKSFGISSYRIGNLSETFGSASVGGSTSVESLSTYGIVSSVAQKYLMPYLQGGYCIR